MVDVRELDMESVDEESFLPLLGKSARSSDPLTTERADRLIYSIFFLLGSTVLCPWNFLIISSSYLGTRLVGSGGYEYSFRSWIALAITCANLTFLFLANYTQHKANPVNRIRLSILAILCTLSIFVISTLQEYIEPRFFFTVLMICTITGGAGASFLDNASVALASKFGPQYLQAVLSGQGAVAFFISIAQFISAFIAEEIVLSTPAFPIPIVELLPSVESVKTEAASAFSFSLSVMFFVAITFLSTIVLARTPLYRLVRLKYEGNDTDSILNRQKASITVVAGKVKHLGLSIFLVYLVTISVFPAVTSLILSVNVPAETKEDGLLAALRTSALFIPLGFCTYATGDWIGRTLPQFPSLRVRDWRILLLSSIARIAFIPLFLLCNVPRMASTVAPELNSDLIFFLLMLAFSVSNGYVATCVFLAGLVEPSLEPHEVDLAATTLAFYLTVGLTMGSALSFSVRASVM